MVLGVPLPGVDSELAADRLAVSGCAARCWHLAFMIKLKSESDQDVVVQAKDAAVACQPRRHVSCREGGRGLRPGRPSQEVTGVLFYLSQPRKDTKLPGQKK